MHRLTLCLLFATLVAGPLRADSSGEVTGWVTNSGKPVPNYPVVIFGNSKSYVAVTDSEGHFALPNLPPGDYTAVPGSEPKMQNPFRKDDAPVGLGEIPIDRP